MLGSYFTLLLMLIIVGLVASAGAVLIMAISLLRPPRMSDGKAVWVLRRLSPGDVGLRYEDVTFAIRDERDGSPLRIAGWWMPNPQARGRCVVLLHGYADAKVGAIAWAPLWHRLGWNVLAIDLRAHGASGGRYSTAGYWERHDVNQVLNQLIAERPADAQQVVLFGVSLGAAVAAATSALRDDLAAVVLESPFLDFRQAAISNMDRLGLFGRPFQVLALTWGGRIAECDFSAVRPVDLVNQFACPIMLIVPEQDSILTQEDRRALERAVQLRRHGAGADAYWLVPSAHVLALHTHPTEYEERLRRFLGASPVITPDQVTAHATVQQSAHVP